MEPAFDEERWAVDFGPRREPGRYFTPRELADFALEAVAQRVPKGPLAIVDPACGAGAFLAAAERRWPRARLLGLELSPAAAAACRQRLPRATLHVGDALRGGLDPLLEKLPSHAFELWVGNPPYNGTSPALLDKPLYASLRALLPGSLPRGTSLRDDFAFFLLLARRRLAGRRGALAFVTSATLLDAFLYAPLRRALLETLTLEQVVELGAGAFRDTRVRTCVTVWTTAARHSPPSFRARLEGGPFRAEQVGAPRPVHPEAPDWLLRPPTAQAAELDRIWRAQGEPLSVLVPVTLPGLKTRFDELLVDDDAARLAERVADLLRCANARALRAFAAQWRMPPRCWDKLLALHRVAREHQVKFSRACVRPFYRYAGAKHRGQVPASAKAHCYLDRRLVPRGDHRMRGQYDPHQCPAKLLFNTRELPLAAALLDSPGCVHDHRHSRFAPLWVPERIRAEGLRVATRGELGPLVPNVSERGRQWASSHGGPWAAFRAVEQFINSHPVQQIWAPVFGASRELWIPLYT
jgi:hypothetical protein